MAKTKWGRFIERKATEKVFAKAWRRAQRIRQMVEEEVGDFFPDVVDSGIDQDSAPNLGKFTPRWAQLSESWEDQKGFDSFYFHKGELERALLRKNPTTTFGRPQVFLNFGGRSIKVNAGEPPVKYEGQKLTDMYIQVIPFPKIQNAQGSAEELVAGGNPEIFFKLTGAHGQFQRPLILPFTQWYIHVKIRDVMRRAK